MINFEEKEYKPCKNCNGRGRIGYSFGGVTCKKCGGRGKIEVKPIIRKDKK